MNKVKAALELRKALQLFLSTMDAGHSHFPVQGHRRDLGGLPGVGAAAGRFRRLQHGRHREL